MIRHLFKLTWNRKRSTGLVFMELVGCFLVLGAVATGITYTVENWRRPLGFDYQRAWRVDMEYGPFFRAPVEQKLVAIEGARRVLAEVQSMPEVEAAALVENTPYSGHESSWTFDIKGRQINISFGGATLDVAPALGLRLASGRWFEKADEAQNWVPVVIAKKLARARFGDSDPIGQRLRAYPDRPVEADEQDFRVVGVMEDYRRNGETLATPYSVFSLARLSSEITGDMGRPPSNLIVRTRPGTGARFEEELGRRIQAVVPEWNIDVDRMDRSRTRWLRQHLTPLVVLGTVGAFLVLMVGFGLVGVLWHSVTRRTSEIGLRRAIGATAADVRWQIVGELLAVTTLAVGIGGLIFLQFPLLGVLGFLSWRTYLFGLVAATAVLYCFVVVCGLYPGWMATRVHPARALQHE